jgi:putative Mn2+ efflux pump MntP
MSLIELIVIALSLSVDVAVVSVGAGALNRVSVKRALVIAFVLGAAHGLMPLVGWGLGYWFRDYLLDYGRVIGFVLILFVGLKMLKDALTGGPEQSAELTTKALLILAFATGIDALVIGFTFNFLTVPVPLAALLIGGIAFAVSLVSTMIGGKGRHLIGRKVEVVGALALILLAFKVLFF